MYLRLDRAFANSNRLNLFGDVRVRVHHQIESTSDHCILKISDSSFSPPSCKRRFHFEALQAKREDCHEIIEVAWNSDVLANTHEGIAASLSRCAIDLLVWNKEVISNILKKIQERRKRLNTLTAQYQDGSHGTKIIQIMKELNNLLDSEEMLWHQRSKIYQYKKGDKNTKFFHARATDKRRKNTIIGLWSEDGR